MTYSEAIFLGALQGLGEFLPISSSAHLIIMPWLFGLEKANLGYSVALHFGTLIAVLVYFFKDWFNILSGSLKYLFKKDRESQRYFSLLMYLVFATVPAALAGFFLEDYIDAKLREPWIIAFTLASIGILLWIGDNIGRSSKLNLNAMNLKIAMIIGFSQALALIPGVSRSGITITTALFLGLSRPEAARFSFLLSTPIILGACLLKYKDVYKSFTYMPALVGLLSAAVFGFLSIRYLLKLVKVSSYKPFSIYRIALALVIVVGYLLEGL